MFPVLSDTCSGQIVYPGTGCAVTVGFAPRQPGEKDASILFITSSSLPVTVVGIDGVGAQPAASVPSTPASLFTTAQSPPVPRTKPTSAWAQWHTLHNPGRIYATRSSPPAQRAAPPVRAPAAPGAFSPSGCGGGSGLAGDDRRPAACLIVSNLPHA